MGAMGARDYRLESEWSVPAPPGRVWTELERTTATEGSPPWWKAVRITRAPAALTTGERIGMAVRSPFGYVLGVELVIRVVEPARLVEVVSTGDLAGVGSIELLHDGTDASRVRWLWAVRTERAWMNATAGLLHPLFALAHRRVMSAGERGLREYLTRPS